MRFSRSAPEARAAVSNQLGYESVGIPLPAGNITIQLSGEGGGFYTSEHFACVKENGDQLSYAFQNNGTEACYVSLYKVGLLGGYKKVTESILIQPGETGHGTYEAPATGPIASASLPSLEEASAARWMLRKLYT